MLCELCRTIIPPDEECAGADEAGVPELIDLLATENERYRAKIIQVLEWLDSACSARYGTRFLDTEPPRQDEIMSQIAFRTNVNGDEALLGAIEGLALLRKLVVGGFFTSRVGIEYLRYIGNDRLLEFPGCPVPDHWLTGQPVSGTQHRRGE